jgi:hypothetical protein
LEVGWEAGIRTPITWSREWCPPDDESGRRFGPLLGSRAATERPVLRASLSVRRLERPPFGKPNEGPRLSSVDLRHFALNRHTSRQMRQRRRVGKPTDCGSAREIKPHPATTPQDVIAAGVSINRDMSTSGFDRTALLCAKHDRGSPTAARCAGIQLGIVTTDSRRSADAANDSGSARPRRTARSPSAVRFRRRQRDRQ